MILDPLLSRPRPDTFVILLTPSPHGLRRRRFMPVTSSPRAVCIILQEIWCRIVKNLRFFVTLEIKKCSKPLKSGLLDKKAFSGLIDKETNKLLPPNGEEEDEIEHEIEHVEQEEQAEHEALVQQRDGFEEMSRRLLEAGNRGGASIVGSLRHGRDDIGAGGSGFAVPNRVTGLVDYDDEMDEDDVINKSLEDGLIGLYLTFWSGNVSLEEKLIDLTYLTSYHMEFDRDFLDQKVEEDGVEERGYVVKQMEYVEPSLPKVQLNLQKVQSVEKNGENEVDLMKRARSIYQDEIKNSSFNHEKAWAVLRKHAKWDAPDPAPVNLTEEENVHDEHVFAFNTDELFGADPRPRLPDKQRREKKIKSDTSASTGGVTRRPNS
nr:hypothetical protein [Tanacetum cinerariifolium]